MAKEKSDIPIERIAMQIYVIRGESVVLDAELASQVGVGDATPPAPSLEVWHE